MCFCPSFCLFCEVFVCEDDDVRVFWGYFLPSFCDVSDEQLFPFLFFCICYGFEDGSDVFAFVSVEPVLFCEGFCCDLSFFVLLCFEPPERVCFFVVLWLYWLNLELVSCHDKVVVWAQFEDGVHLFCRDH